MEPERPQGIEIGIIGKTWRGYHAGDDFLFDNPKRHRAWNVNVQREDNDAYLYVMDADGNRPKRYTLNWWGWFELKDGLTIDAGIENTTDKR